MLLEKVAKGEINKMTETLLDAFEEDELWDYISNSNRKIRKLVFHFLIILGLRSGKIFASENFEGVAVWLPAVSFWSTLIAARKEIFLCFFISPRGLFRTIQYLDFCTSIEDKEGHWTLFPFGVVQEYQRSEKKIGTHLMEESLAYFDEKGVTCYLDTDEKTTGFYERFDFVAGETFVYRAFQVIPMARPIGLPFYSEAEEAESTLLMV